MKCFKCHNPRYKYVFSDETREVTATCACGNMVVFKAKPRKPITRESLMKPPAMAIFENGKLRKPTKKEIKAAIKENIRRAEELNLI